MYIAGIDEAGRGPLAGPVISAVVILNPKKPIAGLTDSKLLTPNIPPNKSRKLDLSDPL